jgi:DNA polymerase-4
MDRFFCACEEKADPRLAAMPFAVCGDPQMRHGIVMSANSIARKYGVRAGLSFTEARLLCPELRYVTADYPRYLKETKGVREVFGKYGGRLIPYGMDEGWICHEDGITLDEAQQIGKLIRIEVKYALGLSVSIGLSDNMIFSKIASDLRKPNSITVITEENYRELIWRLKAKKLLFVGAVREKKLAFYGIKTIGDIARTEPSYLYRILRNKAAYDLWAFANGDDRNFSPECEQIKSIGNTVTTPRDMQTHEEAAAVFCMLAAAVSTRLKNNGLKARCVAICLRDSHFQSITRQTTVKTGTDSVASLYEKALSLMEQNYRWQYPLRSVGLRVSSLTSNYPQLPEQLTYRFDKGQVSLFDDDDCDIMEREIDVDAKMRWLTERFGEISVEKAGGFEEEK